ncbi:MAG TPA: glucose 1-dehydrogenase [Rhodothermales bacterium]|nr:glucose 1-dehydrogenase [Rhodothermales bacterium]
MSLTSKITLVTGAGSGIGAAVGRRFGASGAFVYVVDIDETKGQATVADLTSGGHRATFLRLDVSDPKACDELARQVLDKSGRLDVLVNNAGIGHVGTILQTTAEDLDRLYAVNVRGVFNLSKAFISPMIERGSGSIINMASIAGIVGITDRAAYTTTKFAVVGLTKAMALDHAKTGVRINCICPARVETPFVKARIAEYPDPEKAYREMSDSQPIGRMATPDEIAAAALYFAQDESAFVTGTAFVIDGAFSAGR